VRFENTCAVCLHKHAAFLADTQGKEIELQYVRTKDGREVDFVIAENDVPLQFIEVKLSDSKPSGALRALAGRFPEASFVQLVYNLRQEEHSGGGDIVSAGQWLANHAA